MSTETIDPLDPYGCPSCRCEPCRCNEEIKIIPGRNLGPMIPQDKHKAEMLRVLFQRDAALHALCQAYSLVMGRPPKWSNAFGYEDAVAEIGDAVNALKHAVKHKA